MHTKAYAYLERKQNCRDSAVGQSRQLAAAVDVAIAGTDEAVSDFAAVD